MFLFRTITFFPELSNLPDNDSSYCLFVYLFGSFSCNSHPCGPIWTGHLAGWLHSWHPGISHHHHPGNSFYVFSLFGFLCPGSRACLFLGLFPCFVGIDSSFWDWIWMGNFVVLLFSEGHPLSFPPSTASIKCCHEPAWVKGSSVVFSAGRKRYARLLWFHSRKLHGRDDI